MSPRTSAASAGLTCPAVSMPLNATFRIVGLLRFTSGLIPPGKSAPAPCPFRRCQSAGRGRRRSREPGDGRSRARCPGARQDRIQEQRPAERDLGRRRQDCPAATRRGAAAVRTASPAWRAATASGSPPVMDAVTPRARRSPVPLPFFTPIVTSLRRCSVDFGDPDPWIASTGLRGAGQSIMPAGPVR